MSVVKAEVSPERAPLHGGPATVKKQEVSYFSLLEFQPPPPPIALVVLVFSGMGRVTGVVHVCSPRVLSPSPCLLGREAIGKSKASFAFVKRKPMLTSVSAIWPMCRNCFLKHEFSAVQHSAETWGKSKKFKNEYSSRS